MTMSTLLIFAAALLVAAGSPGPSVAALVARVLTNGLGEVLPFLAAMWLGEILWLTCAVAGLVALAHTFATVFFALKLAGVAYLLYLAWKMWFAPAEVERGTLPGSQSSTRMFMAGLTLTLGNPKIMVFYLSLLPTIIDLNRVGVREWAQLSLTTLMVLVAVDLGWSVLAARARALLKSPRAVRVTNRCSAAIMAGAAAMIASR